MIGAKAFTDPLDSNWVPEHHASVEPGFASKSSANKQKKTDQIEEITLDSPNSIIVEITDALSEREKVKYTIRSRTKLADWFSDFSVVREHEEFLWLHNALEETESYAPLIIPPMPSKPTFILSQKKLLKLASEESNLSKEEYTRSKQELEQEYLALFKKTVAMHEAYLQRLAAHPIIRNDANFKLFLQYDQDLCVRAKNTKEIVGSLWKKVTNTTDQLILNGQKDPEYLFEIQRSYMSEYYQHINQAAINAEKVVRLRKVISELYANIHDNLEEMSRAFLEHPMYIHQNVADWFAKMKKVEIKSANDEELKLSDTLTYLSRDTQAAKDLLCRRLRCLTNYVNANRDLDRARAKNKDISKFEAEQASACKVFEDFSALAKNEIIEFKNRRTATFEANIRSLIDLEIRNEKCHVQLLQDCLTKIKEVL